MYPSVAHIISFDNVPSKISLVKTNSKWGQTTPEPHCLSQEKKKQLTNYDETILASCDANVQLVCICEKAKILKEPPTVSLDMVGVGNFLPWK